MLLVNSGEVWGFLITGLGWFVASVWLVLRLFSRIGILIDEKMAVTGDRTIDEDVNREKSADVASND